MKRNAKLEQIRKTIYKPELMVDNKRLINESGLRIFFGEKCYEINQDQPPKEKLRSIEKKLAKL